MFQQNTVISYTRPLPSSWALLHKTPCEYLDLWVTYAATAMCCPQVLPLIQLQDPSAFDRSVFWGPLLAEARATTNTLVAIGAGAGGSSLADQELDDAEALLDEAEDIAVRGLLCGYCGGTPSAVDVQKFLCKTAIIAVVLQPLVFVPRADMHMVGLRGLGVKLQSKILRVKGLGLKSTGNRKRSLDAMTWSLSPGLKIAVKVRSSVLCHMVY